jgi:hypothetical protein
VVEERELVSLLLSTGVLVLAYRNRRSLAYLTSFPLLLASVALLAAGFIATVLEGLFWSAAFNFMEHVAYGVSSVLLALWAWTTWMRPRREGS